MGFVGGAWRRLALLAEERPASQWRKMNILFCDCLKVESPSGQSTHIHEVLGGLAKIGHNIVPLNADYIKDEAEVDANLQPSRWTRIKGSISESQILKPIIGEITILWSFLREIYIFIPALIIITRRKGRIDIIYRRHNLFNTEYLLGKLLKIPSVREVNRIVADEARIAKQGNNASLRIIDRIERFSMPRANKIIVVTSKLKEVLQKDYGVPEIINDGENGFLIEPQSSAQIAEKASFILRNDILRERMSRNNRECVRRYDWESIGSSLEEVYSEITQYSQPNKGG